MYKCFECGALNKTSVCSECGGCCEREQLTQSDLAKATGLAQPQISKYLKQIKQGDLFRKPILKILEVQGKGDLVRAFVKKINGEVI